MQEVKAKMPTRSSRQQSGTQKSQTIQKQTAIPKTRQKNVGHKRMAQQKSILSLLLKKQQSEIVVEQVEQLYTIRELLKQVSVQEIVQHCPKIKIIYQLLCSKLAHADKLVLSCLDKYFHGNTTSLWSNKYAPRTFNELFQSNFAQKIQQWIKDFYYFRKEACFDDELDFIDDQPQSSYSKSLQVRMKQYGWNCRALVLKGRNGVGKTSFLNAIAKSMNIRCFQYASDVDQLQKMKQMTQGCQSQCVDKYQIKKKQQQNNKIIKQNNLLTKFMPKSAAKKESLDTKQPKRIQLFRAFNQYFAPYDRGDKQNAEDNYFKHLFDSINKGSIPYILTTNKEEINFRQRHLNQKYSKFDQIQFIQNSVEDLTYLYWLIFQIQTNLRLSTSKKIRKDDLYLEFNKQFESLEFKICDNLHLIRELVTKSNKKPLYIAKNLQFIVRENQSSQSPDLKKAKDSLETAIDKIGYQILQNISSQQLIYNIDWSLYQKFCDELNPLQQTAATEIQKSQKSEQKSQQLQIQNSRPSIKQLRQKLELNAYEDRKVFQNQYYHYKSHEKEECDNSLMTIPTTTHVQAKCAILKNVKSRLGMMYDRRDKWEKKNYSYRIPLKQKEMFYLPLLFAFSKRPSRSLRKQNKECFNQNLSKIMNPKEFCYMKKFAKLVYIQ